MSRQTLVNDSPGSVALSILVISYNTRELTLACLRSVYEQTRTIGFEVIVVDNASSDGSADAIAAEFQQVRLTRSNVNLGFAAANNLAARDAAGRWLLLLNPDTVVLDGAVDRLVEFAESNPAGSIFGGRTVFADGSLNAGSCWRRATPWSTFCAASGLTALFPESNWFARESYGSWQRDSVRQVDIVSGCFFLIARALWNQLDGFDPAFFMYGEEADLCLRARTLGHAGLITPGATVIHLGGASESVRADKMVRLFKAKAQLIRRHWSSGTQWFGIACLRLWTLHRMTGFALLSRLQPRRQASYQTWSEIWRRRSEWSGP